MNGRILGGSIGYKITAGKAHSGGNGSGGKGTGLAQSVWQPIGFPAVKEESADPEMTAPSSPVTFIGGARVGLYNVTWPFARLRISGDELVLWVLGPGSLRFPRAAVEKVEKHTSLLWIGGGVRIVLRQPAYDDPVIFWSFRNPEWILREMEKLGFLTKVRPDRG